MSLQEAYIDRLLALHTSKHEMVKAMMVILSLSKDAVYRRLRGATALTAEELLRLQQHYHLSYEGGDDSSLFQFNFAEKEIRTPTEYVAQLSARLEHIKTLSGLNLLIANPGIPFFHEMMYPRLFAFKLFIYGSTCWNLPGWKEMPFKPAIVDRLAVEQAQEIAAYSYTVPGKELWSMGILHATLDQIEFMHLAGRFADPQEAFLLLDELGELVDHLELMARTGRKFRPGADPESGVPFSPAQNELANNDNVILIQSDQVDLLFATFITPNFLQTSNPRICRMTKTWFHLIDDLSTPLGAAAGRHRHWFFNRLRRQLAGARERVSSQASIEF